MAGITVLASGIPRWQVGLEGKALIAPYVGARGRGRAAEVGLGFAVCRNEIDWQLGGIWGWGAPHRLIQPWRAMVLVDEFPEFSFAEMLHKHMILEAVFPHFDLCDVDRIWSIAHAGLGRTLTHMTEARARVYGMFPSDRALAEMLEKAACVGLMIDRHEIEEGRTLSKEPYETVLAQLNAINQVKLPAFKLDPPEPKPQKRRRLREFLRHLREVTLGR